MAYPKEIMDKAFETLAERRSQARNDYQYRLQVIREKAPAVEELRRELTGTSAAIARTVLSGVDVELDRSWPVCGTPICICSSTSGNCSGRLVCRRIMTRCTSPVKTLQGYRLYRREDVPLPEGSSGGADAGAALPYCQYR